MAQMVRHGHHAMGRVAIWAQWLIIAAGVLLSRVFAVLLVFLFVPAIAGGSIARRSARPEIVPQSARDRGTVEVPPGMTPPIPALQRASPNALV
jgi:hypothetical protein